MKILKASLLMLTAILAISCRRPPLPPPIVLFDQGHDQQAQIEHTGDSGLFWLAKKFSEQGFEVRSSTNPLSMEALKDISTLIISGPLSPLSIQEIQALHTFLNQGGQLCIMLEKASPAAQLLETLNVAVSNGVIQKPLDTAAADGKTDIIFVTDIAAHPLTKGINQLELHGSWALNTQLEANVIAKTSSQAWIDLNHNNSFEPGDAQQSFSVIITGQLGHGHFIVFADDTIFLNRFLKGQNLSLAENIAQWLRQGSYY